jgi:hypothetical protein
MMQQPLHKYHRVLVIVEQQYEVDYVYRRGLRKEGYGHSSALSIIACNRQKPADKADLDIQEAVVLLVGFCIA